MAFVVNPVYASTSFGISVMLFVFIMFRTPGSTWGYISQALIFHQVNNGLVFLLSFCFHFSLVPFNTVDID